MTAHVVEVCVLTQSKIKDNVSYVMYFSVKTKKTQKTNKNTSSIKMI